MKGKGILDEIEKIVDEVWDVEKKQINIRVDNEKKKMDMWMDAAIERQMKIHHDEYKNEYLQEVQRRRLWDTPMLSTSYGGNPRRSPSTLRHKCSECGVNMKVVYIEERIDFSEWRAYDSGRFPPLERVKHDRFYCPRCRQQIHVVGKVIEITVEMTVN